ncbi:MAG: hypothetical protein IJU36_03890 [Paludibacteraceae bacterium]|jgi:hypothetical protein|nr:hypothetical protein [Paludibacteraceae bacterium]
MSILFPKVRKPREWDYRPIYYDEEKEARKQKLARLHRGSFREEHEKNMSAQRARQKSKLTFWVALLLLGLLLYYFLR